MVTDMMRDVARECSAAAAAGIPLPDDLWHQVRAIGTTMKGQMSSTAMDLARGRPTEIDHLNGYVVAKAALGVATPVNRALLLLVRLRERAAAGPESAPEAAPLSWFSADAVLADDVFLAEAADARMRTAWSR